ncbi:hypothetical protein RE474_01270 [Methanolobus sediminis]|uniref:Uncharacterized protein n=1 Tax=Methanolobus sediminis TaxID=3072978 RepID=A0AA51UL37_9EURY|nr:hypothetical protein [Methanolobus sediminis]WMW25380.1 hypothetical protein RE474_01270 [Methanolobus sediminis]
MENMTPSNIDPSLYVWAKDFCKDRKESIDYFLNFGSPIEKALVSKVIELAEVQA